METKPRLVKRLFWDIEVSHNVVLAFRAGFDQTINPESIIKERKIICIGYKWEGDKRVHVLRWDKNQDDKAMLQKFALVANEADEMVGHHLDRYDVPFFRTRCLFHGIDKFPCWKTLDTCAWAKKYFMFNSGKLDYISRFLGLGGKVKVDHQLWHDVLLKNCPSALNKMCHYCGVDVIRLEGVYHKLKFCVKPKSHQGVMNGLDRWTCPRSGSTNIKLSKVRVTSGGIKQYQMQNLDDGTYFSINGTSYESYKKAKAQKKVRKPNRSRHHK